MSWAYLRTLPDFAAGRIEFSLRKTEGELLEIVARARDRKTRLTIAGPVATHRPAAALRRLG